MNRTYSRGKSTYRVTGRWPDYGVAVRCDCIFGPHWHHLGNRARLRSAERLISEHAFETCREGDGLASNSPQSEAPFGASSRQPVDRTPRSLANEAASDRPGVRSTPLRRIQ